tara:strand:- start:203 stop:1102 length:900 start_codon:yes stop_codon:yes gene_type:complete
MGLTKKFERQLFFVFGRHIWNVIGVSGFVALLTGAILFTDSLLIESTKSRREYLGSAFVIKSKKDYLGDKLVRIKSKKEYFGKEFLTKRNLIPVAKASGDIKTYAKWLEENKGKGKKIGYKGQTNWYWTVLSSADLDKDQNAMYENYKRNRYQIYMQNSIPAYLLEKLNSQDDLYAKYKSTLLKQQQSQDQTYAKYKSILLKQQQSQNQTYANYKKPLLQKQYEQNQFYSRYKLAQTKKIESQESNYQRYVNKIQAKNARKYVQRGSSLLVTAWGFGVVSTSSIISSIFSIERNTRDNA